MLEDSDFDHNISFSLNFEEEEKLHLIGKISASNRLFKMAHSFTRESNWSVFDIC